MPLDRLTQRHQLTAPINDNATQLALEHQIIHWVLLFSGGVAFLSSLRNLLLGMPVGTLLLLSTGAQLLLYSLVRRTYVAPEQAKWAPFLAYLVMTSEAWFTHAGPDGSTAICLICPTITAMILLKRGQRLGMLALLIGHLLLLFYIAHAYPAMVLPYPSAIVKALDFLFSLGTTAFYCINTVAIVTHHLEQRRRQTDALLLNLLPLPVAETLKQLSTVGAAVADHYDQVSIMFIDVVDFTTLAADLPPATVVALLNDLFSSFDRLADIYGVEKIKTIGDCYMVAAGVPQPRPDHAQALVQMALAIQENAKTHPYSSYPLRFRIGINSGPVVAGIIGQKKFIYDLWGDAVNVASRMESQGQAGAIQITRATYELIANDFICETRGAIPIKGKGMMEIWHVIGKQAPHRAALLRVPPTNQLVRPLRQQEQYG